MSSNEHVSPDGSPLAVYLALPPGRAPELIHAAIEPNSSILELGSGPGRLTHPLVALGHDVTAVDDSEVMLAHVTGADTVCADAFELDLGRTFDTVLAASNLINRPGEGSRRGLLGAARRHIGPDGLVVVERHPPGWLLADETVERSIDTVRLRYEPGELRGNVRSAVMTYRIGSRTWRQRFDAEDVTDAMLQRDAAAVGLRIDAALDDAGSWLLLAPAG